MRAHELRSRVGKEPRQIDARHEEIARLARAAERVAQHGEKYIGRGELGRRVERRDAKRTPQIVAKAPVLALAGEQLADADIALEAVVHAAQTSDEARGAQALGDWHAARHE